MWYYCFFLYSSPKTDREGYTTAYRYTPGGKTASILYGDGTHVEMEYDALRRLVRVKDWLGETAIERDALGRPEQIRDHRGRETSALRTSRYRLREKNRNRSAI